MLEALDARADVSREASEEIARLRTYHRPAAGRPPAPAGRSHTAKGDADLTDSTAVPRTPPTPGSANPLLASGQQLS